MYEIASFIYCLELRLPRCVRYAEAKRGRGSQNTTNIVVESLLAKRHVSALLLDHHQVLKIQIGGVHSTPPRTAANTIMLVNCTVNF
jgi:hypothetical protein